MKNVRSLCYDKLSKLKTVWQKSGMKKKVKELLLPAYIQTSSWGPERKKELRWDSVLVRLKTRLKHEALFQSVPFTLLKLLHYPLNMNQSSLCQFQSSIISDRQKRLIS